MNAASNPTIRRHSFSHSGECRSEQTEAYVFAQLAGFDELFGAGRDVIDAVIDSMLDAGELRSSVIDARRVGFGYLPTLTAA